MCVYVCVLLFFFLSFLARLDTDGPSIMTFSEIGSGSPKRNAFDRCLGLQLHKSRYSEREAGAALRMQGVAVFRGISVVLPIISAI